ncbi:trypsin-like serine peptidase, partial [Lichenibacterium minor]|uniref:trypsin-like serine peptidase n=1 Tax=Lichenibacterium minor TaxID=2316528 RepID=UPI0013EB917B
SGKTYTSAEVIAGHDGHTTYGSTASAIHAMPDADWTQLSNAGGDFALIHLATPITDVPVMSLGSDFTGGAVTVTGYPAATSGQQDSAAETVSTLPGYAGVLQGTALGAPGDAHGASGGPVWTEVGGVPTVVGLTQSEAGSTGYFLQLTDADVAQIRSWISADEAQPAASTAAIGTSASAMSATASVSAASAAASASTATSAATSGTTAEQAIAFLSSDAAQIGPIAAHGYIDHATSRVVALLTRDAAALGATASFDDVASDVLSRLGDNSQHRNLAASLLEGLVWGHDGGATSAAVTGIAAQDPGLVSYHGSVNSARAGSLLGHALRTHGF